MGAGIAKEVRQLGKDRDQATLKTLSFRGEVILDDGFWIFDGNGALEARCWMIYRLHAVIQAQYFYDFKLK